MERKYLWNGTEYTFDELVMRASDEGVGVNEFIEQNGIQRIEPDFQKDTAEEDAAAAVELYPGASELELELEELLSDYNSKYTENQRKRKGRVSPLQDSYLRKIRQKESSIQNIYDAGPLDFDIPATVLNRADDYVQKKFREKYPWLRTETGGIDNKLKIYLPNEYGGTQELDLKNSYKKQDNIDLLDSIKEIDQQIAQGEKTKLTFDIALDELIRNKSATEVNSLLEGTGYNIVINEEKGMPTSPYAPVSTSYNYELKKDNQVVEKGNNLFDIEKYLEKNVYNQEGFFDKVINNSYEIQKTAVIKKKQELEKARNTIQEDTQLPLRYFENEFQKDLKDLIEASGQELTSEDESALYMHFQTVKASSIGNPRRGIDPISQEEQIKRYRDLSQLPEELQNKLVKAGINEVDENGQKLLIKDGLNALVDQELDTRAKTIVEDVVKANNQDLINLSQRFIFNEQDAFNDKMAERVKITTEAYENYSDSFGERAKAIMESAPEGTEISIDYVDGNPIIKINNDRNLTTEEGKQLKLIEEQLLDLQFTITTLQQDYLGTLNNIQLDIQEFYAQGKGVDAELFDAASRELNLIPLLAKDVNDSFASLLLTVPTLLNSEWAINEQRFLNEKNEAFETMKAYDDGDFLRYALRTTAQQSANLTLAIATAGTASGLGLTSAMTKAAIGGTFGLTSGTQTYRDLNVARTDLVREANQQQAIAKRAFDNGTIGLYEYNSIMRDTNNTISMNNLTDSQIVKASIANGLIEGTITGFIGTAPNSIKLIKDFAGTSTIKNLANNLYKGNATQLFNYIGKPLVVRPLGEVIEETSIYATQQFVTEYGLLDRDLDLSQLDDTAMSAIVVSANSQSPGIAYGGLMTYGKTKKYEQLINKLQVNNQNLSDLIAKTESKREKELLLNAMTQNFADMALETDMLAGDILNLGSVEAKRLVGLQLIKNDFLAQSVGITPNMTPAEKATKIKNYKKDLNANQKQNFNDQLNALDTQINNIHNKIEKSNGKKAAEALGDIYLYYDAILNAEDDTSTGRERVAKVIQRAGEDITASNIENAKSNPEIVKIVENQLTDSGTPLDNVKKDRLYAYYGRQMGLNAGRALANKLNIDAAAADILGGDVKLKVQNWKDTKELAKLLEQEKLSKKERLEAFNKLKDGNTFGLIVGNKIFTQRPEEAQQDIDNGIIRAGTVILHEINHAIDDGRITTRQGKIDYATNLFKAASESNNAALRALHLQTVEMLNELYGPNGETFENSEKYRDEYTKYLQEQAFAFEDQLQLEKDDNALVRAFNNLTTNANALNTPKKALDYMLANNNAFRRGKLSKKSQRALRDRKGGDIKFSERTINEDAKKYKADNPDLDMAKFLDQYKRLGLRALGYSQAKGDIATDEAIGFIMAEFPSITRNFDPDTAEFSTYATNVLRQRGKGFYKQELAPKEGKQRITLASEATRLVAEETAEAGIELAERAAQEKRTETRLINPLKSKDVSRVIKDIENIVDIKPEEAPIADFKNISQKYAGKVASKIFNVPESKITDGAKNLTYAKKIVDGVPQQSEAGNIQNIYSNPQALARDIRLLPDTNVTSDESRVGVEKVPVTRDVQGRSLGLPNKIIKYFYEDTGKRSKGTTSQTKVYKKKAKFNNPSPAVIKQVQRDMGITPAGRLNNYDRNIGQLLKGFAKVKGAVTSVAMAKQKIGDMDLRTAKPKKQIQADIGAGRSRVQFSEKVRGLFDLDLSGRSKVDRLMSVYSVNPTLNLKQLVLTEEGREQIVNTFRDEVFILLPKAAWQQRDSFTSSNDSYGISISKGTKAEVEGFRKLKSDIKAAIDSAPDSAFGANIEGVTDFKLSSYDTVFKGSETDIKDKADKFNDKTTKIHKALWERINKRIAGDKQRASAIATYLKLTANDKSSWHRKGAAIYGYSINPKQRYEYEHAMPATSAYLYLLNSILGKQNFSQSYDLVMQNYKVIALDKAEDNKLRKAGLQRSMPFGWDVTNNFWWQRYFNPVVAKQNNGINPASIVDLNGDTLQDVFLINNDGSPYAGPGFVPQASSEIKQGNTADDVMNKARNSVKYSEKTKKARVFDFDDTLARSKSKVIVTMPDGTKARLSATEFALKSQELMDEGAEFDFSQFDKVIDGKKGPLFDVAKKIQDAKNSGESIFILTARPQDAAPAIKEFLSKLGLNIPLANITGLADGRPQAKADWFIDKYNEGFNDFYFADDALKNVKAVKDVFDVLDVKSRVQQARVKFSEKLSTDFNKIIERNKGIPAEATISDVKARRLGKNQKRFAFFIPPSADDFRGLTMYTFAGKGRQGEADQEFFDKALIRPYQRGVAAMEVARTKARTDYVELLKNNRNIKKKLSKKVAGTKFTLDEAVRIYLWDKAGYEVPGLSKTDKNKLVKHIEDNNELIEFANGVKLITRKDTMYEPDEYWDTTTILGDLNKIVRVVNRQEFLKEFNDNADVIFSKENLNKVEAIYGFRVREALENVIFRMKTGTNATKGAGRIVNAWNNWVNNSVGAIMFFNRRSALLQTISTVNFVNWSDNNPIKAGIAFANQPQYWSDFKTLWNSPKLVSRRRGLQSDIQESEIAAAARKGGVNGAISYLLKIGFTPTQLADSFAIASGGATFYRNRINSYKKKGLDNAEAEKRAFEDFGSIADETQQSADPMLISSQQSSVLGRLVLAFQNTPMQYTRLIKKAGQDLINKRGNPIEHISKIVYYGFVQNLIFSTLQNAMFALLPGFEDEEEPEFTTDKEYEAYMEKQGYKEQQKITRILNNMTDTLLRGSGLAGAVASTVKNVILEYQDYTSKSQFAKENADILLAVTSISPPINYKLRQINNALQTKEFEKDVIAERGFDVTIDGKFMLSPSYDIIADISSATLNLPLNRAIDEINAVSEALDTRNTIYQRIALAAGWRVWDVGAQFEEHDTIKTLAKEQRKAEGIEKAKKTREENKMRAAAHKIYRVKVLRAFPEDSEIRKEILAEERRIKGIIPKFRLDKIVKENNLDVKYIDPYE